MIKNCIARHKLLIISILLWGFVGVALFGYIEDGYLIRSQTSFASYLIANLVLFLYLVILLWILIGYPGLRKSFSDALNFMWTPLFMVLMLADYISLHEVGLIDGMSARIGISMFGLLAVLVIVVPAILRKVSSRT